MVILGTFLLVVHILVAVLMCIVILMQSSKGEGLSGAFGMGQGTSTFFGADTANVLVKLTTVLAIIFMVTSLSLAYVQAAKARSVASGKPKADTGESLSPLAGAEATGDEEGLAPDGATTPGDTDAVVPEDGASPDTATPPPPDGAPEAEVDPIEGPVIDSAPDDVPTPPSDEVETPPNIES